MTRRTVSALLNKTAEAHDFTRRAFTAVPAGRLALGENASEILAEIQDAQPELWRRQLLDHYLDGWFGECLGDLPGDISPGAHCDLEDLKDQLCSMVLRMIEDNSPEDKT